MLYTKENGLMGNPMELDNCFLMMALTFMEHLQMGLCKAKEDLYLALNHIIKVKYGIMLLKEKENIVTIYKNIHIRVNG